MSRKKPIVIQINKKIEVEPEMIHRGEVVRSGNGAVIKSFKRFIGRNVTIIIEKPFTRADKKSADQWDKHQL